MKMQILEGTKKHISDEELVIRAQQGDSKALEQLISRYEDKVYNLTYRILGDENEAYDVLQETAMSVFQHINDFKQKSNFSTWLYRIALNNALMRKRKQKNIMLLAKNLLIILLR